MSPEHDPNEVAATLGIKPSTLRKWSQKFAPLLSATAAASGPTVRRRYSASDIALLRHAQALLRHGAKYAQVREQLAGDETAPEIAPDTELRALPATDNVTVIGLK